MLYLFQLQDEKTTWHVPIADQTAVALECALLAVEESSRVETLAALLARDPALVVWATHEVKRAGGESFSTAKQLATWLSQTLLALLSHDFATSSQVQPADAAHYASLYADILRRAKILSKSDLKSVDRSEEEVHHETLVTSRDLLLAIWPHEARDPTKHQLPTFTPRLPGRVQPLPPSTEESEPHPHADYFLTEYVGVERRLPALVARLQEYENRLSNFTERLEQEKLESLKELAYGAGHEINNPLANIAARAQTMLKDEKDEGNKRKLAAIHRQAMRAHEMIADLMLFARPPKLNLQPCNLNTLVQQVIFELADDAEQRDIKIASATNDEPLLITADETQLGVAIRAVVSNALEAIGTGGHVEIAVQQVEVEGGLGVEITVRDDGPGISDDIRRHLFDPFFSGREAGRGLGFGLSKCWRIVTDHGGQVIVSKSARRGAELTITLPIAECVSG